MSRLHVFAALAACLVLAAARPAAAQLSGGLDGKWSHYVINLAGLDGTAVPVVDVWALGSGADTLVAWRSRTRLGRADLGRPLVVERRASAAPPLTASLQRPATALFTGSFDVTGAHLFARAEDGVADTLLHLRLSSGCATNCELQGISFIQLPGASLDLGRSSVTVMQAVDAFPIEPGDRRTVLR